MVTLLSLTDQTAHTDEEIDTRMKDRSTRFSSETSDVHEEIIPGKRTLFLLFLWTFGEREREREREMYISSHLSVGNGRQK